jgi:hypothetical protein
VSCAPDTVRKALVADGAFTREFGLPIAKTLHFSSSLGVDAEQFANALKKILAGQSSARVAVRGGKPITFKGKLGKDGSVTLATKGVSITDDNGGVLAPQKGVRIKAMERLLGETLLPSRRAAFWRDLVKQGPPSSSEFLDLIDECRAVPEVLHERIRQTRTLSLDVLVPADLAYWRALLPEPGVGQAYDAYLRDTVTKERAHQLDMNMRLAHARTSISGISQSLIPFDLLKSMGAADLEALIGREDPFSLLFAFEVAARRATSDASLIEIGTRALDKLFGDKAKVRARAALFSACAVLSVVGLQRIAAVRGAPLFWRRLLAFTHAGVLTNALGNNLGRAKGFNKWAFDRFGIRFFWASLAERRLAPRWWPEWIDPSCLHAEFVGRALIALHAIPEQQRPGQWQTVINDLQQEQADRKQYAQMFFPGPVDDFQFSQGQLDPALFNQAVEALSKGLPLDKIPGLLPFLHSARMSPQHVNLVGASLANTVEPHNAKEIPGFVNALQAAAQAAAANRAVAIADAVAQKALAVFLRADRIGQEKLLCIIVDAANAMLDEHQHLSWLGERLERLAFECFTTEEADLVSGTIEWLFHVGPRYRPYLSRARAIAELFRRREAGLAELELVDTLTYPPPQIA